MLESIREIEGFSNKDYETKNCRTGLQPLTLSDFLMCRFSRRPIHLNAVTVKLYMDLEGKYICVFLCLHGKTESLPINQKGYRKER